MVYYNDNEAFACSVIQANINRGRLPAGRVHCEDIQKVVPSDLEPFRQYHLFAGIGAAAYACRLAGMPDDFSIGTFGFPCQDISSAGRGAGIDGERSGLFFEAMRLWRDVRPVWLLAENVSALRTRGIERVIGEMESAGYCVLPPIVVGAVHAGAPHERKRVWIVARDIRNTLASANVFRDGRRTFDGIECQSAGPHGEAQIPGCRCGACNMANSASFDDERPMPKRASQGMANANGAGREERCGAVAIPSQLTTATFSGCELRWPARPNEPQHEWEQPRTIAFESPMGMPASRSAERLVRFAEREFGRWRRDALKGLGNAWCAQTAVPILRWILVTERAEVS